MVMYWVAVAVMIAALLMHSVPWTRMCRVRLLVAVNQVLFKFCLGQRMLQVHQCLVWLKAAKGSNTV